MYELLKLQAEAWKENKPGVKQWDFDWDGRKGIVAIAIYKDRRHFGTGAFFTDTPGIGAACRFITENLNKK